MVLLYPRRFGEVFQIDRNLHGSLPQQQAIRDALTPAFGTKFAALLHSFDVYFNRVYERHFVNIEIKDFGPSNTLALAGSVSIAFSDKLTPSAMCDLVLHEFGHVLDNSNYITQEDRNWYATRAGTPFERERWADAVKDWVNSDGASWPDLTSILLP